MWAIISTWRMSFEGAEAAAKLLSEGGSAADAVEIAVKDVESNPHYKSVGFGGLPNKEGEVELDSAFMDGDTLDLGAVMGMKGFAHPISVARKLSSEHFNNCLVGSGAEQYAEINGFERVNLRTDESWTLYLKRLKESAESALTAYQGHDTVGVIALDVHGTMAAGTSTSGLFFKHRGRIGDSPLVGSGFYCDSTVGGAAATGMGEDIMKRCTCYDIVSAMSRGAGPQEACDLSVKKLIERLEKAGRTAGDISVIAVDKDGNFGAATNIGDFSFVSASEKQPPVIYVAHPGATTQYSPASREFLEDYMRRCLGGELV